MSPAFHTWTQLVKVLLMIAFWFVRNIDQYTKVTDTNTQWKIWNQLHYTLFPFVEEQVCDIVYFPLLSPNTKAKTNTSYQVLPVYSKLAIYYISLSILCAVYTYCYAKTRSFCHTVAQVDMFLQYDKHGHQSLVWVDATYAFLLLPACVNTNPHLKIVPNKCSVY